MLSATGTAIEFGCRMASRWMSSSSNAWPAVALISTAPVSGTERFAPITVAAGTPPSPATMSATFRVHGRLAPTRQQAIPSRIESLR